MDHIQIEHLTNGIYKLVNHPINELTQCYECVTIFQPQDQIYYYKGFTVCSSGCLEELLCDTLFDTDSDYNPNESSDSSFNSLLDTSIEEIDSLSQQDINNEFSLSHLQTNNAQTTINC